MSELTERGKALLEGVTEGVWRISDQGDGTASVWSGGQIIFADESGYGGGFADLTNAEFIAASRQLVPELIAEVELAQKWAAWFAAESLMWRARAELHISECAAADAAIERVEAMIQKWDDTKHLVAKAFASEVRVALQVETGEQR